MESPRFGVVLRDTSRLFLRILRVYAERYDVSLNQYLVLRDVLEAPGSSQRDVSVHLNIAEPTIVATVDALIKRSLLLRTRSASDRRQFRLYLTSSGRPLAQRLVRHVVEINRAAMRGMTGRQAGVLRDLLSQAKNNLTELAARRQA